MDYIINQIPMLEGMEALAAAALFVELVFGVLNCFFGYKLLKVWVAVCGFLIGAGVGFFVTANISSNRNLVFGVTAVAGVVAGVLAYEIYLVGAFFLGWLMTVSAVTVLGRSMDVNDKTKLMVLAAGVLLGVFAGILIVRFARPCIIVLTGVSGGISAATAAFSITEIQQPAYVMLAAGILLAVLGIIVQFMTTPHHKKKSSGNRE